MSKKIKIRDEKGVCEARLKYTEPNTDEIKNKVVELKVGYHTIHNPQHYANGWFEVHITYDKIELWDGEEELQDHVYYVEGGLWFDESRKKVVDYDGAYSLNEKLKPLFEALGLNVEDVY